MHNVQYTTCFSWALCCLVQCTSSRQLASTCIVRDNITFLMSESPSCCLFGWAFFQLLSNLTFDGAKVRCRESTLSVTSSSYFVTGIYPSQSFAFSIYMHSCHLFVLLHSNVSNLKVSLGKVPSTKSCKL